jgi:cytochrome c-type biogenesis protein CcmH
MSLFIIFAIVMTVLAAAFVVTPLLRAANGENAPVTATIMALAVPASVILLYVWVGNFDWSAKVPQDSMPASAPNSDVPDMSAAITSLEDRLRREPEDLEGWLLLGRANLQLQQYPAARQAYLTAIRLDTGTEARIGLAETEILLDRTSLTGDAGTLIEEVLAVEPDNPRALFYGGMAAMARNDIPLLRQRWQRLLALSPPPDVRQMIEAQLAALDPAVTAEDGDEDGVPGAASSVVEKGVISVRVAVVNELSSLIKPGAVLFLVAREPARPGPPIAVVKQSAANLPAVIEISDANAMLPGRSISGLDRVQLIARISNSGEPIAQPGDISGERILETATALSETVTIDLDQVVQ